MKKFTILLIFCLCFQAIAYSRDYTKLQVKEAKHAQKYGTTKKYTAKYTQPVYRSVVVSDIKDPKQFKIADFKPVSEEKYNKKIAEDDIKYKKIKQNLCKRNVDNYNAQAKGEDYYKVYRVAERIIRANNLDYSNWKIAIYRDSEAPNAYSTSTNYIAISTSLYDNFCDNEDALALIIGHEIGHGLLGHQARLSYLLKKMTRAKKAISSTKDNSGYVLSYIILERKYLIESKNAEYAADNEGAKLAAKAGYNLDNALEVLNYLNTMEEGSDYRRNHPTAEKRIESFNQNRKYFVEDQWAEYGKYNIYNSNVINAQLSSDRKTIVLAPQNKNKNGQYYHPETPAEMYARFGYKSYLAGEFAKSVKFFDKSFNLDKSNASAYLYASYAYEQLYNQTKKEKYKKNAKECANFARAIDPKNKYYVEQYEAL